MRRSPATIAATARGVLLLLLCLPSPAWSLENKPLERYFREAWSTRDGLPHNLVQAIAQTPDGYLWFGTWEGLVRYNGVDFEVFDRGNVRELQDSGIRSLHVARDGRLLIGTSRGGVTFLDGGRWSTLDRDDGLPQDDVSQAIEDRHGRLWVASESAGVARIDGQGRIEPFRAPWRLPSDTTYAVFESGDGSVWVATADGAARIRGDEAELFGPDRGLPPGAVFAFAESANGDLFAGTEQGIHAFDGERFAPVPGFPGEAVHSLMTLGDTLWAGTVNQGLLRLDRATGRVEGINSIRGLPNNRIASLFMDREGSVWAGTNAGLLRLRDAPFTMLDSEHRLSDDYVRALAQAKDGTVWVGTSRGLNRIRAGEVTTLTHGDGLPGDSILSLMVAADGALWIGTYANGLARYRDGAFEYWTRREGLPSNQVRAIVQDASGEVWVGTTRGLARLRDGRIETLQAAHGLPRDYVMALHAAADGRLWIGTSDGAAVLENGRIRTIDLIAMDDARDVFGFHEDADGGIWMATDRGVVWIRGDRQGFVGQRQGLPIGTVFQVVADRQEGLWLTSNRGVIRIDREDALAVAAGERPRLAAAELFNEADGMNSAQCNGSSGPTAILTHDGEVWIATARGLAIVDPARVEAFRREPPAVVIERVLVDGQPVQPQGGALRLAPGTRKLEFHYVGLDYQMPRRLRYRYQLEGFDSDWTERGALRTAQFTNLAPGQYRFRVAAAIGAGEWGAGEGALVVLVDPYWYQDRQTQLLIALAVLLALYGFVRFRLRGVEAREREMRRFIESHAAGHPPTAAEADAAVVGGSLRIDSLTGLPDGQAFEHRLASEFERSVREARPLAMAVLEIDQLAPLVQAHPREATDAMLRDIAGLLRRECRASDLVARLEDGLFAILLPDTTMSEARMLAEHLRAQVEASDLSAHVPGAKLSVSVGLSDRSGASHAGKLLARAKLRLSEARQGGRNRIAG